MKYSYAAVSDVGKREINEDALEAPFPQAPSF